MCAEQRRGLLKSASFLLPNKAEEFVWIIVECGHEFREEISTFISGGRFVSRRNIQELFSFLILHDCALSKTKLERMKSFETQIVDIFRYFRSSGNGKSYFRKLFMCLSMKKKVCV